VFECLVRLSAILPPSSLTGRKGGRKQKQRLTQAASDAGSKKKDKNVKDGGGVVAAVTRQATKFSNGNTPKEPASLPESPPSPAQTPELKPAALRNHTGK
ncbi:hypothetical protein PG988_016397, partial [Apiospora saccharicola]